MRWFGESWGAPINELDQHAPTPVDAECAHCHTPILEDDIGFLLPRYNDSPEDVLPFIEIAYHHACFMVEVLGPDYVTPPT